MTILQTLTYHDLKIFGTLLTIGVVIIFIWIISGDDNNDASGRTGSGHLPNEN